MYDDKELIEIINKSIVNDTKNISMPLNEENGYKIEFNKGKIYFISKENSSDDMIIPFDEVLKFSNDILTLNINKYWHEERQYFKKGVVVDFNNIKQNYPVEYEKIKINIINLNKVTDLCNDLNYANAFEKISDIYDIIDTYLKEA